MLPKLPQPYSVLAILKRGTDRPSATKTLSFGEKIAKIGPADPEVIFSEKSLKREKKKKKTERN